jgi:hypothetical protein
MYHSTGLAFSGDVCGFTRGGGIGTPGFDFGDSTMAPPVKGLTHAFYITGV